MEVPYRKVRVELAATRCLTVMGGATHGEVCALWERVSALSLYNEQSTQNWSGQGESDCLIKTKHCDGLNWC